MLSFVPRIVIAAALCSALFGTVVSAQPTAFSLSVAEAASDAPGLSAYYRRSGYRPLWTGPDAQGRARRAALLAALERTEVHGLPGGRDDAARIRDMLGQARDAEGRGRAEVALSRVFVSLADDLGSGILVPSAVVPAVKREAPRRDPAELLAAFEAARPEAFIRELTPRTPEYARLVREKLRLEEVIAGGGWGATISASRIELGDAGDAVVALRDRLRAMGYFGRDATAAFGPELRDAVAAFQADHGLATDGIVGGATLAALNLGPVHRLGQILVAMERERWLDRDLGRRHVWVNLTDFKARIVEDGEVAFETRSVIGKHEEGRETPEFSDVMEHMVINPTWYVPRSIVVGEYLPGLRRDPGAFRHLDIVDRSGRVVSRNRGFGQYDARSFPFSMRQPPSPTNALGLVKFMFPNKYNIYLHDTPTKNLFDQPVRAFSHGCIRLSEPFEFAYALLAAQTDDPEEFFQRRLQSGQETRVPLDAHLPVHLVYRTAISKPRGGMEYRGDVYGRDAAILAALQRAGVALPGNQS